MPVYMARSNGGGGHLSLAHIAALQIPGPVFPYPNPQEQLRLTFPTPPCHQGQLYCAALVRVRASFPTLMTSRPILLPAKGGKGQDGVHLILAQVTA